MAWKVKRTPLTTEQFELIGRLPNWQCYDIPRQDWGKIPGLERLQDTIAVMGSASITDLKMLNGIQAVAGLDVLVHETHPMVDKGEPEGNAYHFVVQKVNHPTCPYILHGPIRCQAVVPHWFKVDDLTAYDNR
jgi:hypothetical protein